MKAKIVRRDPSLPLPAYQTDGAVAFDLYSREDAVIQPKEVRILPSNFIIAVPEGYFLLIANRSGTAKKKGLMVANGIGVIDQDYHGPEDEVGILAYNFTDAAVEVRRGERIAQGLFVPMERAEWEEVTSIKNESRGGFGGTGQ